MFEPLKCYFCNICLVTAKHISGYQTCDDKSPNINYYGFSLMNSWTPGISLNWTLK